MFRRILVAVDGSPHAARAASFAGGMAEHLGSTLRLITVYAPPSSVLGEPQYSRALEEAIAAADEILAEGRAAVHDAGGPEPELDKVASHDPAQAVVQVAREQDFDLVVMGARGMGRVRSAVLGSVSAAVIGSAGRPVLVVGPEDRG